MTNSPVTKPTLRGDILAIIIMIVLIAAVLLVPVTRDFVLTNIGIVFSALAHAVLSLVSFFFGGAA